MAGQCGTFYNFADVNVKFGSHRFRDFVKQDESIKIARGEIATDILKGTDGFNILTVDVDTVVVVTAYIQPGSDTDKHLFNVYSRMQKGYVKPETFSIVESNLDTGGYSTCSLIQKAPDKTWGKKVGVHEWQFVAPSWVDEVKG